MQELMDQLDNAVIAALVDRRIAEADADSSVDLDEAIRQLGFKLDEIVPEGIRTSAPRPDEP